MNKIPQYIHTGFFYFLVTNNSSPSLGIFATPARCFLCSENIAPPHKSEKEQNSLFFLDSRFCARYRIRSLSWIFCFWFDKLTITKYLTRSTPTRAGRFADFVSPRFESCPVLKIKSPSIFILGSFIFCARYRIRTCDLPHVKGTLYRLS